MPPPPPAALDTTKDPCQKVKCSRHKVCVAQGYQRAMCISRKKLEHRYGAGEEEGGVIFFWGGRGSPPGGFLSARCLCRIKQRGGCKPCHAAPLAPVCGSDGHTYSSAVSAAAIFWGGGSPRVPP